MRNRSPYGDRKARMTSSQHGSYALGYTHTTMAKNNGLQAGNGKVIPEISPQFRLKAAIRLHEVGIASNRGSACRGEYVLGSCTHRPSRQESWGCLKCHFLVPRQNQQSGLSRACTL